MNTTYALRVLLYTFHSNLTSCIIMNLAGLHFCYRSIYQLQEVDLEYQLYQMEQNIIKHV